MGCLRSLAPLQRSREEGRTKPITTTATTPPQQQYHHHSRRHLHDHHHTRTITGNPPTPLSPPPTTTTLTPFDTVTGVMTSNHKHSCRSTPAASTTTTIATHIYTDMYHVRKCGFRPSLQNRTISSTSFDTARFAQKVCPAKKPSRGLQGRPEMPKVASNLVSTGGEP